MEITCFSPHVTNQLTPIRIDIATEAGPLYKKERGGAPPLNLQVQHTSTTTTLQHFFLSATATTAPRQSHAQARPLAPPTDQPPRSDCTTLPPSINPHPSPNHPSNGGAHSTRPAIFKFSAKYADNCTHETQADFVWN